MMPDGMRQVNDIEAACARMHDRLICWGRLFLAGGSGARQKWESDGQREYFDYGASAYDDAKALHSKIIQLPQPQHSLLLQAFYRNDVVATTWGQMSGERQRQVGNDLAAQVNGHIRRMNRQLVDSWRQIEPD